MASSSMMYLSFYLLMPLLPLYMADTFNVGKDTIGVILTGFTIAAMCMRPLSGHLVDTFNRKKVMMLFIGLFGIVYLGYLAAGSLLLFALLRTLHGAPYGAMTVANSTVAIDVLAPSRRNEGVGYYGLSTNIGMALGPALGLWLYNFTDSFATLFWTAFGLATLGLLFAKGIDYHPIATPYTDTTNTSDTDRPRENSLQTKLRKFFLTRAWLLAVNIALFGCCFGALSNYIALLTSERYGSSDATGTFFAILAVGLISSRLIGARGLRKGRISHNATIGMLIALTGYIIFVSSHAIPLYYFSALLIGYGNGHMYPAFLNMFIDIAHPDERGNANSTILTGWDAGFGIGVLIGGLIAESWSLTVTFTVIAAIEATGVILFFCKGRRFYEDRKH